MKRKPKWDGPVAGLVESPDRQPFFALLHGNLLVQLTLESWEVAALGPCGRTHRALSISLNSIVGRLPYRRKAREVRYSRLQTADMDIPQTL
jgi:hypothetical protein